MHEHITHVKKGGTDMTVGERIEISEQNAVVSIAKISNIVPVSYKDDGEESWYEVCDANKTLLMAIVGEDNVGMKTVIIIDKETCNTNLLIDLL